MSDTTAKQAGTSDSSDSCDYIVMPLMIIGVALIFALTVIGAKKNIRSSVENAGDVDSNIISVMSGEAGIAEVLDVDYWADDGSKFRLVVFSRVEGDGRYYHIGRFNPQQDILISGDQIIFKDGELVLYEPEE